MTRPTYLLMDANVLIDFLEVEDEVDWLLAKHIGPLQVAADVLREVDQLTAQRCMARKIKQLTLFKDCKR